MYLKLIKMKKYLFLPLILFAQLTINAQNAYSIKFFVVSKNLPDSVKIYITGNDSQLGNWNPGAVEMNKVNDSTWEKEFDFSLDKRIEFKFTQGTWKEEALNDDKSIPENKILIIKEDTAVSFNVKYWGSHHKGKVIGQITGNVEYIRNLKGEGLKPRDVIVWLPPGYKQEKSERYPVLYMQDGQNIIDPQTANFGVDWRIDETADSLIKAGEIKKIIVVGIYNTANRFSEYAPTDTGNLYMEFVVNKLKPLIDKEYRTLPDAKNTAVGGSSLGGLISFMLAWNYTDIFSKAICFSPAFDIDEYKFINPVKSYTGPKKPLKIFINIGTVGLEDSLMKGVDEMLEVLKEKGYQSGKDLMFYKDENAMHSEAYWAKQVWRFLEFMFGEKQKF
jgi:enterochelin esterase-like enzyme